MLYVIFSLFILFASYFLFRSAAGSLSIFKPNPITYVFYYQMVIQTFIASILAVTETTDHYIIGGIDFNAKYYGWLSVQYAMIAMPIGMLMAKFLFFNRTPMRIALNSYHNKKVDFSCFYGRSSYYALIVLTFISALACIYTFYEIGYIPILKLTSIDSSQIIIQRIQSSRSFDGIQYIKNIPALIMMPIISYAWISTYIGDRKLSSFLYMSMSLIFAVNILIYDLSKSPIISFVLGLIWLVWYSSIKLKLRYIIIAFALMVLLILYQYYIFGYDISKIFSYNTGPVGRIILTQAAGLYYFIDAFPDKVDYLGFTSISRVVSWIFNTDHSVRASRIAMELFRPEAVKAGEAGVMNSIYLAEAWANFGISGIIISPILVGFFIETVYIIFLKMPKSPIVLGAFARFSIAVPITGGFNDFIYPLWIGFYFMVIVLLYIISFIVYKGTRPLEAIN